MLSLLKITLLFAAVAVQSPDTAKVRLHISKMTCGSCPATARLALKRLTGVYTATVTLDDSLGVVKYDPRRVTPAEIAAHLTRLTGFGDAILSYSSKPHGSPGAECRCAAPRAPAPTAAS